MTADKLINELRKLYWNISSKAASITDKEQSIQLQNTGKLINDAVDKIKEQADLIDDLQLLNKLKD